MDPTIYAWYERLRVNPDDAEALAFLWDHFATRGEFQQLATLAEQIAGRRREPSSSADLFYRAGEIWAKNVGRPDKAVACYKRSFELDPAQLQSLEAACQIYVQIGNHKAAAPLTERLLATVTDPLLRVPRLRDAAALYGQAGDNARRIACLEELYALSPDDWDVMRDLAESYLARSQTPHTQPDDTLRAANLLGSLAVAMGPEHGLAFAEIALDTFPGDELAYQVVHEAYGAAGRIEDLAVRQIAFVVANPASVYTPVIRRSLGEMYASVNQIDDAIACLEPLLADDPSLARFVGDLYRQGGYADKLAALYESLAPGLDLAQRVADLKDLAEVQGRCNDRAAMLATMRAVLEISSADTDALTLVEDDLRVRGRYEELRDTLLRAVRAPDCAPEVRTPKLREVGRVCAEHLSDLDGAIAAWREVVETIPTDGDALRALGELLERSGRWEELADVLGQRADLAAELDERRALLRQLADVHRERRDDPNTESAVLAMLYEITPDDDALALRLSRARRDAGDLVGAADVMLGRVEKATGREVVTRQAEHAVAREAAGQLQESIDAWRDVVGRDPEHPDAWANLERLLSRSGQHQALYATLVNRAEALPEGRERAALHARAADAARAMGDAPMALAEAERAVRMAPDDDSLAGALMDALQASGDRARLLAFVKERTARVDDGAPKVELLRRAARAVGADDQRAAREVWEELRVVSKRAKLGDDAEALEVLMELAEARGDHEGLAKLFVEAAEAAKEPDARREILKRRAMLIANELGRVDDGIDALAAVARDLGKDHAETWVALEKLAERAKHWPLVTESLERQIALRPHDDDEGRATLAARLVAVVEQEVNTPAALIHALEIQHGADPGDLGVIQRLADLCEAEERYREALGYLDQLLEIEGDDEEISKLSQRVAHLADEKLGDQQRAWEVLIGPVKTGDVACIEMLLELSDKHDMHAGVVPVLSELAGRVSDRGGRAMLWREVARRKEEHLHDPEGAFEAWVNAALARDGRTDDLARIDALAATVKRPQRVVDAYRAVLDGCTDPTVAHELSIRGLAAIESSGGRTQAFEFALSALAKAPADDDVLDAVVRLAPGPKRHADIFVAFDRRKKAAQTDAERFAVTLRAAELAGGALGDQATAFQYIEQAIGQAVGRKEPDEEMLARIENAAIQADQTRIDAGMVSGLVERYAAMAAEATEDNPRVAAVLLRRAGTLCEHELALADHAFGLYSRAVSVWPDDVRGASSLEDAAARADRLSEVVALYARVIDEAYDARIARTYTARRAALLADRLGRVEEAIDAYQRLAELAPKDIDVLRALQALLERHQRWQPLLMALERELEVSGDRAGVYRRVASVWEHQLRNTFEARDNWRRVLKLVPGDDEARAALERLERRPVLAESDLMALEEATPARGTSAPEAIEPQVPASHEPEGMAVGAPSHPSEDASAVEPSAASSEEDGSITGRVDVRALVFDGTEAAAQESVVVDSSVIQPEAPLSLGPVIGFADPQPQAAGRSFLDAVEVSAELVAAEDVDEVEASAAPAEMAAESSPSLPPPLPRVSTPPPLAAQAPASPLDALAELSMSDAEEIASEEIEEGAADDAPSLDALAALTSQPKRG